MPIYNYRCACGHECEAYHTMRSTQPEICPACSQAMQKVPSLPHTDLKEFHTPIEMYSVAMEDQDQIRAFKQQCPDVECSDDPANPMYGVPIARHRKGKLQALAAAGFVETK